MLLKIIPPEGVETFDWKRPYLIIDPRAGHGAGIGGFKPDSQVGVALHDGHPVYFVVFRPEPERGQTLADVMRAEAAFVKEIASRHPKSPKPIIVGNCQGGWATMVLAAANPEITGPLVINGAPLTYWSGRLGENPMRYNGGLLGGVAAGAIPIRSRPRRVRRRQSRLEFRNAQSGPQLFRKILRPFRQHRSRARKISRIRTLVGRLPLYERGRDSLDRRAALHRQSPVARRGAAGARPARSISRAIRSPIIVFASWGDNITPPQQALNWIVDTYADEHEIKISGQRIIYMIHEKVGHLGIFVSSSIAKRSIPRSRRR